MTRIDFYSLETNTRGDRFLLTCRLVERIRADGLRILIHCPDPEQAQHIDRLLWTFREDSFIPHGMIQQVDPALTPVLISTNGAAGDEPQVLINLALEIPNGLDRFQRLCEPIDHDTKARQAGRERFRHYRQQGYPLEHHSVRL